MKNNALIVQLNANEARNRRDAELEQQKIKIWQQNPPSFEQIMEYTKMQNEHQDKVAQEDYKLACLITKMYENEQEKHNLENGINLRGTMLKA